MAKALSPKVAVADETAITEITISADGRIHVFGLSLEVAQVLSGLCPAEHPIAQLVARFAQPATTEPASKEPASIEKVQS